MALSPKALDLLLLFVSQPSVLFTKDDIFQTLWPDVTVTDNALTQVISELRQALGDKPNAPTFIETVSRRGYRWVAPVENLDPTPAAESSVDLQTPTAQAAQLQSAIVTALMAGLRVTITATSAQAVATRETPSLEALRLTTEGRLKLETLEPRAIQDAIRDFTRAIALDPSYTTAHIGLAHARFWQHQATRARNRPDLAELNAAIAHAERAVELDPSLADAHAALAFFLSITPRVDDALREGRLAVSMEPGNWRHQFQLGMAAWGSERLDCLTMVMRQYPALTHAHFAAAMVHIARGDLDTADAVLAEGLETQRKTPSDRLPGRGLLWLRGLIALRRDRVDDARVSFDAELSAAGRDLFADEFAMDALSAHGFSRLASREPGLAADWFARALQRVPDHAKSWLGLGEARRQLGDAGGAADARVRATQALQDLSSHGRQAEAALAGALAQLLDGDIKDACATLTRLLQDAPAGLSGWTLPVEPWLKPFIDDKRVVAVLKQLAERAR